MLPKLRLSLPYTQITFSDWSEGEKKNQSKGNRTKMLRGSNDPEPGMSMTHKPLHPVQDRIHRNQ